MAGVGPAAAAFEAALQSGDAEECAALLRTLAIAERRALAARAIAQLRHLQEDALRRIASPTQTEALWTPARFRAARLAVLGTATLAEIEALGLLAVPPSDEEDAAVALVVALDPSWRPEWAEAIVAVATQRFSLARRLVRDGVCRKPTSDAYTLGLLERATFQHGRGLRPLGEQLLDDPGLLEDEVYRLFVVEGSGELSLAAHDKYSGAPQRWDSMLADLAARGHLSRVRLLDLSLEALARDTPQFRAGWFSRFHEMLAPTAHERAQRTERYLQLLASRIPPTVTFAVQALGELVGAGLLEPGALIDHLVPALRSRTRKTAEGALRLLDRSTRDPAHRRAAVLAAAEALAHEATEVQERALRMIEAADLRSDDELRETVARHQPAVSATLRPRVAAWFGEPREEPAVVAGAAVPAARREGLRAMEEIRDQGELLDHLAHLLEDPGDADEIERVLAGVSRLPAPPAAAAAPLLKRARSLLHEAGRAEVERFAACELARLAVAWIAGEGVPRVTAIAHGARPFVAGRLAAITSRAALRQVRSLLSAPTHAGGFIDPLTLVERWRAGTGNDPWDLVLALLRLAGDGRADALAAARDVPGETGAALRHALGAPGLPIGPSAWLWIAAARARDPRTDDTAVETRHPGLGAGAGYAGRFLARHESTTSNHGGRVYTHHTLRVDREPVVPAEVPALHLSVLLHAVAAGRRWYGPSIAGSDASEIRWSFTLWPGHPEPLFAEGVELLAVHRDGSQRALATYLEPLLQPHTRLGPNAARLLALGLAAKETSARGLATDALVTMIEDGRYDVEVLGAPMAALLPTGMVKPARWAKALAEVARVTPGHARAVAALLVRALRGAPPRDLAPLLGLLVELFAEHGGSVGDSEVLAQLAVVAAQDGKAGQQARRLMGRGGLT